MKHVRYSICLSVLMMMATLGLRAQDNVTVTVEKKTQNFPSTLSSYVDDPYRYFRIRLHNNTPNPLDVSLSLEMTCTFSNNGKDFRLYTDNSKVLANNKYRITLPARGDVVLNNANDFETQFDRYRLTWTKDLDTLINDKTTILNQSLPEGQFEICVKAYEWKTPMIINNATLLSGVSGCETFSICYSGSAPEFTAPIGGLQLMPNPSGTGAMVATPARNINFRWIGVVTNCPQSVRFDYTVSMVKVLPGQNVNDAIDRNPTVYLSNCGTRTYCTLDTLRDVQVRLERGATYAVCVEAQQRTMNNLTPMRLGNGGRSQIQTFVWGTAPTPPTGGTSDDDEDDEDDEDDDDDGNNGITGTTTGGGTGGGKLTQNVFSNDSDNKDSILAQIRQHYIVYPAKDQATITTVTGKFSGESSNVPSGTDSIVKSTTPEGYAILDVKRKKDFALKWIPAHHDSIKMINYEVKLYEYLTSKEVTLTHSPIKSKTIRGDFNTWYGLSNTDAIILSDTSWTNVLELGKKYYVSVDALVSYMYAKTTVTTTQTLEDGEVTYTDRDTTVTRQSDAVHFESTLIFQWGIDKALLDNLTPPKFTYPIDRSTALLTDTTMMEFGYTIPEVPRYHDFSFDWMQAAGADVTDTVKYDLHVWKVKKGKTVKQILKDTSTYKVRLISDLTCTDSTLMDSLKTGETYLARLYFNAYPDTNKYDKENGGWSLPIWFKLVDTTAFSGNIDVTNACYPGDTAGLSKQLISPKVDSLVNNRTRIKIGEFDLIMQQGKYDAKKGYTGTGFVIWRPAGFGCNIKVHFDSIKINKDYRVVSGTARSIATDSNNYLKLNLGDNKYGAGFDMGSDKAVEYMNKAAQELGSTGDDIKTWYDRINLGSNALTEIIHSSIEGDFSMGTVTTPIRVNDKMMGSESENVLVAVNDLFFSPVTAQMNLLAVFGSPRDKLYIPLLATNICIKPDKFIFDTVNDVFLFSPRNYEFELSDGYTMRFKMPSNFADIKDGTYLAWNKTGYKEINIDVDIDFGVKGQPGNKLLAVDLKNGGIVSPTKPVQAHFTTKFKKWGDWIAKISMDPFTIAGCEDWTFLPTGAGIWYDHSETETPKGIKFPDKYNKKGTEKQWTGFYMDRFSVLLPADVSNTFVDLNGEEDETPDSTVVYKYGANGEKTDSVAYVYEGTRMGFGAQHLIIDDNGISVELVATDLLKLETKNGGGWYFSIDTIGLCFEKNSYKYGKIQGKVELPLFDGNMGYSCMIGSDSLVFAVQPKDSLKLNLFLANVELDKKSSHFKITHDYGGHTYTQGYDGDMKYTMLNKNSTTRVDLTLNGKININFSKIGIDASLPDIKFENMYMRNFRATKVQRGKSEVEAYKFGELDFSIGNWSKASPQKYIGTAPDEEPALVDALASDAPAPDGNKPLFEGKVSGFKYSVNTLTPTFEEVKGKSKTYKVGIDFAGSMEIGIGDGMSVGASAGFGINCVVDVKNWKVSDWGGTFDSARITTDIGPLSVDGFIAHTRDDAVFGNSWRGTVKVKVMDVVECRMGAGFGTKKKEKGTGDYDWWFFEGAIDMGSASPMVLGPVTITGFGGGFAYNCKPAQDLVGKSAKDLMKGNFQSNMVSSTGSNYTPCYDAWMAKCGISLALSGDPSTLNADGTLNLRIANGHFSGICLQVNCRMMSSYDDKNKEASGGIVEIGAFIDYTKYAKDDWAFTFSAICKSDINMKSFLQNAVASKLPANIKYPEFSMGGDDGCLSKYVEPVIKNSMDYDSVEAKTKKYNSKDFGGSLKIQIPIDLYIRKEPKKDTKWFFALGRPAYDDRVQLSASFDLVVCKASTAWTFYFMTGNYFPDGFAMPDIPEDVANFLGDKYLSRAQGKRKLPTFKDAGGFAIGTSFYASIEFSMLLYLKAKTFIGFDAAVINTNGEGCEGYSKIGKNGYYGMGQAYVMFEGEAGLELNLGFWKGHISLVEAGLGALVQAGGPNPTWAFGMLKFRASCLGGLVKISTSVDFELGHTCVPGASDPLANVKLFQSVTPAYSFGDHRKTDNIISPTTTGTIVSNMPWNQDVLLSAMDDKANTVTRKFRFILDKNMSIYRYWDKNARQWKNGSLNIYSSSTDENTLYFEDRSGGFKEGCELHFILYGRVFEYRPSINNKLSDYYLQRDSMYYLYENRVNTRSGNPLNYKNYYGWRAPLYTDNGKTTFKTQRFYQDTDFYVKTSTPPENLYNQVVFTWPYNGDPQVPYQELYKSGGRYYAVIYVANDRDFLNPSKLDADGRQIMAFLVENGWGESAEAQRCDYYYYANGYAGSYMPCILVKLPSDFNPTNYQNHNLAVRLMLVKNSDFQAQLRALNNQANQLMTQTRYENQTRSNLSQLRNEYYEANRSSNRGTEVTQGYKRYGSGAATGEGNTNTKFNLKLAQLREATNAYSGVRDTAMNFSRKSLASGYVAAVRSGSSVYNLYFRLCSGLNTYNDVIDHINLSYLFSTQSTDDTHNGSSSKTFKIRKKQRQYNADEYSARHAYLFAEWEPDDPNLYKTGIRLPAIIHAAVDYETSSEAIPEIKLYKTYFREMGWVNNAVKNTAAPVMRVKQNCTERYGTWNTKTRDIFCGGVKSSNWKTWTDQNERTRISVAAQGGLVRLNGNSNFSNLNIRIDTRSSWNSRIASLWNVSDVLIPSMSNNALQGAPRLLRLELVDQKGRIDSSILEGQSKKYIMGDNRIEYYPEMTYSVSFDIVDEVTGTMFSDMKYFNEFFQSLVDYGIYMHSRGYSHKVDQLNHLMKQSYYLNPLQFNSCPLTFPKSILGMWWMNSFLAQYRANEELGEIQRSYYKKKPMIERNMMTKTYGDLGLYWQDYVLRMNRVPYEVSKTNGTVYEDLFTSSSKYYSEHDFNWFSVDNSDGIVSKNAINNYGSGGRTYMLDLYWFSPNTSGYSNSLGYMANCTKETALNNKAHPFVTTMKKTNCGSFWFKLGSKFQTQLGEMNGLKFRYYSGSGSQDWFE